MVRAGGEVDARDRVTQRQSREHARPQRRPDEERGAERDQRQQDRERVGRHGAPRRGQLVPIDGAGQSEHGHGEPDHGDERGAGGGEMAAEATEQDGLLDVWIGGRAGG